MTYNTDGMKWVRVLWLLGGLCACSASFGACDLRIVSVYTCDTNGNPYVPVLGDRYVNFRVNWEVVGVPSGPYDIRFNLANQSWTWTGVSTPNPGSGYWGYVIFWAPLDGPIPASVTLDPGNVSGDVNLSNNTGSLSITPTPPNKGIDFYATRRLNASQTFTVQVTAGTIGQLSIYLGKPISDTSQKVISGTGVAGAQSVLTEPFSEVFYRKTWSNIGTGTYAASQSMVIDASNVRINVPALRRVSWHDIDRALSPLNPGGGHNDTLNPHYIRPEDSIQCKDAEISAFVSRYLPADYRRAMRPIDAARSLFKGVAQELTYTLPPPGFDAKTAVNTGQADCGGFSALYAAACRNVGIPVRLAYGWREGTNAFHVWTELWLPGYGWIPQDVTDSDALDPSGQYAYAFGVVPDMNARVSVSRASSHSTPDGPVGMMQVGAFYYWNSQGAAYNLSFSTNLGP